MIEYGRRRICVAAAAIHIAAAIAAWLWLCRYNCGSGLYMLQPCRSVWPGRRPRPGAGADDGRRRAGGGNGESPPLLDSE